MLPDQAQPDTCILAGYPEMLCCPFLAHFLSAFNKEKDIGPQTGANTRFCSGGDVLFNIKPQIGHF